MKKVAKDAFLHCLHVEKILHFSLGSVRIPTVPPISQSRQMRKWCLLLLRIYNIYDRLNITLKIYLQIGPTKNICNGSAATKFIATV